MSDLDQKENQREDGNHREDPDMMKKLDFRPVKFEDLDEDL